MASPFLPMEVWALCQATLGTSLETPSRARAPRLPASVSSGVAGKVSGPESCAGYGPPQAHRRQTARGHVESGGAPGVPPGPLSFGGRGWDTAQAGKAPLPSQAFQAHSSHVGCYLGSVGWWCVHSGFRGGVGGAVHFRDIFQVAGVWVSRRPPDTTCKGLGRRCSALVNTP